MLVYVVRHAEAEGKSADQPDEWRHLTEKGRRQAERAAGTIAHEQKARTIITSPLTRAVQTAEIIAGFSCRKRTVEASPLLVPGVNPHEMANQLRTCNSPQPVMLVGHEPQLGALVGELLGLRQGITLKKGACIALNLDRHGKTAQFQWYAVPGKKRVTSLKKAFGA